MKILFISYFFPPDKSVGAIRAASLVKHFPEKDIDITLLTADTSEEKRKELEKIFQKEKFSLSKAPKLREIGYKTKILSLLELLNLEHYFFFPDVYSYWIRRTYKIGKKIIQKSNFDAVLITLPPYSSAVIGYKLAKKFNLPLILDYRDPWSSHIGLNFPKFIVKQRQRKLERKIASYSKFIVTVIDSCATLISEATNIDEKEIVVIPNGYSTNKMPTQTAPKIKEKFTLSFFGNYSKTHGNTVKEFVLGFRLMVEKNKLGPDDIAIRYAGIKSRSAINRDLEISNITEYFDDLGNLEVEEMIKEIQRSHINYVFAPKILGHNLTTKIFDYCLGNSHVLIIGEKESIYDWCISIEQKLTHVEEDRHAIAEKLEVLYNLWKEGKLEYGCNVAKIAKYNRKELAFKYANLLHENFNKG